MRKVENYHSATQRIHDSKWLSTKISWTLMPKLMYEQSLYVKIQIEEN